MKIAVYPGSFDPITNGHLNIIERTTKIVDKLIVAVAVDSKKSTLFSAQERTDMIKEATKDLEN
ncbi:adenylyltransferase/cytidyltransferase family protein, partial [bacterium]|nr:adenylyltransferase/cytidyltransferase family protein [bacterium]